MTTPYPEPLDVPGPAQSDFLIHFCGRPSGRPYTPMVPAAIQGLTPAQRLDNILWEQRILGFPPFGAAADQPMVCFSESPLDHLQWLLQSRGWPPWGVVLSRQWVYATGGGPIWYTRPEQYESLSPPQRPWAVRFETTTGRRSDWVHEREWRIPVRPDNPALQLGPGVITAVLVDGPTWLPTTRYIQYPADPAQRVPAQHPLGGGLQRWWWDRNARRFVAWPTA
jgi:hypothetical protein